MPYIILKPHEILKEGDQCYNNEYQEYWLPIVGHALGRKCESFRRWKFRRKVGRYNAMKLCNTENCKKRLKCLRYLRIPGKHNTFFKSKCINKKGFIQITNIDEVDYSKLVPIGRNIRAAL